MTTTAPAPSARDYLFEVFYSPEDDCYVANAPDLTYCSAVAATPEEAVKELRIAVRAWLDAAAQSGRQAPEPMFRPQASGAPREAPARTDR
jgi:predicted RNase H-like HicB family nuclease